MPNAPGRPETLAKYRRDNLEKIRASSRDWYHRNPDKARANHLWTLYRLTPEQYESIRLHQGGVCAACGKPPGSKRLAVDHRHSDGLIRGLLCWSCNYALGVVGDDPKLLHTLAAYLDKPPAVAALEKPVFGLIGKAKRKKVMIYGGTA